MYNLARLLSTALQYDKLSARRAHWFVATQRSPRVPPAAALNLMTKKGNLRPRSVVVGYSGFLGWSMVWVKSRGSVNAPIVHISEYPYSLSGLGCITRYGLAGVTGTRCWAMIVLELLIKPVPGPYVVSTSGLGNIMSLSKSATWSS